MSCPQTCLPIHKNPVIIDPKPVLAGCDWPAECPPEPIVDGCDCSPCARDPNQLFGPDSTGQISNDFIIRKPTTITAVGLPCDAFAVLQVGLYDCGCYVYDDLFECGNVVRLSRNTNRMTLTQPGRYRLKLFNANPSKVHIRKSPGRATKGVLV